MAKNDRFNVTLDMNDPDFARKFGELLGLQSGDTVSIATPQFDREDGVQPVLSIGDWESLRQQPASSLATLGCRRWDEADANGNCLMLLPAEWYEIIPDDFEIEDINGKTEKFKRGETDDDKRFGVLPYGLRVKDDI